MVNTVIGFIKVIPTATGVTMFAVAISIVSLFIILLKYLVLVIARIYYLKIYESDKSLLDASARDT